MMLPDGIVDLVSKNDPILRKTMPLFDFDNPPVDPVELERVLARHLIHYRGFGLAAPQIGLEYNSFVLGNTNEPESICSLFNPDVVWTSETERYMKEGCLSFPDLNLQIKRPVEIRIRYQDYNGNVHAENYRGITARILQHECDHLKGVLFTDHACYYHMQRGKKQARLVRRMRKLNLQVINGGKNAVQKISKS